MLTVVQKVHYGIHMNNKRAVQRTVVHKIENHMAAKGIKRKELIDALGWSYERFRKRMEGDIPFDVGEIWVIASILRTSPIQLMPDDASEVQIGAAA